MKLNHIELFFLSKNIIKLSLFKYPWMIFPQYLSQHWQMKETYTKRDNSIFFSQDQLKGNNSHQSVLMKVRNSKKNVNK